MAFITTIDAIGLTHDQFRAILDEMGVEPDPEPGLYQHLTVAIPNGLRVIEVWDHKEGFESFMQARLAPAAKALGLAPEMHITIEPLYNIFVPRLEELPGLVANAPGRPGS
jgi:hypothetical protein